MCDGAVDDARVAVADVVHDGGEKAAGEDAPGDADHGDEKGEPDGAEAVLAGESHEEAEADEHHDGDVEVEDVSGGDGEPRLY